MSWLLRIVCIVDAYALLLVVVVGGRCCWSSLLAVACCDVVGHCVSSDVCIAWSALLYVAACGWPLCVAGCLYRTVSMRCCGSPPVAGHCML